MNQEEAWAKCPVEMANMALRIAREYGYAWQWSPAVPQDEAEWAEGDPRPSLAEIEATTPEAIIETRLDDIEFEFADGRYCLHYLVPTGHTELWMRATPDGEHIQREVIIRRDNGDMVRGVIEGGDTHVEADLSGWNFRHEDQWARAWETFGIEPPPFPGELTGSRLVYGKCEWPDDLSTLNYATIYVPEWAIIPAEHLRVMLDRADSVILCDKELNQYPIAFVEHRW
jgi:hypothetical protein